MLPEVDFLAVIPPTTELVAAASNTAAIDTKGYDFLFLVGSDSASNKSAACKWTELRLSQTPTSPTAFTDGTAIVAFEGGTAVDATHGFEIPTASTTKSNGFLFKVDLKGVDRYLAIEMKHPTTDHIACYGLLARADQAPAAANTTTTVAAARNVVAG